MLSTATTTSENTINDFQSCLKIYYERLFPIQKFCSWLSYSQRKEENETNRSAIFSHREFSFTLADDVYLRFQSFSDESEFTSKLIKMNPYKIDIGAIYNAKPSERKSILNANANFKPVEKELVFDIDMTDYDDVRKCCKDKTVCIKCWKFIEIAVQIIDAALREDFGFKHLLWVFSGRRGIHCWVCDERARKATSNVRKSVVNYLEILRGTNEIKKKVSFSSSQTLHPSIKRASLILEEYFEQVICRDQKLFCHPESCQNILWMIPDEQLRERIKKSWESVDIKCEEELCLEMWKIIKEEHQLFISSSNSQKKSSKNNYLLKHTILEIMFQLLYPRLDSNVSIQLNHLLKSPFCIHPDSGKVSVPLTVEMIKSFDPSGPNVPTLNMLIQQLDHNKRNTEDDLLKTSLKPYVDVFTKFIKKMEI